MWSTVSSKRVKCTHTEMPCKILQSDWDYYLAWSCMTSGNSWIKSCTVHEKWPQSCKSQEIIASFTCKNLAHMQDKNLAQDYALELVQESCKIRIECIHLLVVMATIIMSYIKRFLHTMTIIQILCQHSTVTTCTSTTQRCEKSKVLLVTVQNDY